MSRRTERSYKADGMGKLAPHSEVQGSVPEVNGPAAQGEFTSLRREICVPGPATPPGAANREVRRVGTEVSRGHSSEVGPSRRPELVNWSSTDRISQTNLVGKDCAVQITRGPVVTDRSDWKSNGALPDGVYRQCNIQVTIERNCYDMAFAFPEPHARYLYGGEVLNFATEYFHVPGSFEIYLWGLEFLVEGQDDWRPVFHWRVDHHDGSLGSFGARLGEYDNHKVVVFGTQDKAGYQPAGTVIYIGERPAITDVTVVPQGRQISLSLPTNRFDATNGFIIERFTGLGKAAECVASSETLTNLFAFDTADAPAEFYRCQFGLHVVALPIADTNLAAAVKAAIALRNVPPTNALYDVDLNGVLAGC